MNLILLEPNEIDTAGRASVAGVRATHLLKVLKVSPGTQVRIGVIDGPAGIGIVESVGESDVALRCVFDPAAPVRPRVDLLLALPRPKVMQRLWAQLTAIGVGQIVLTNAARVERQYFDTHVLTPESYRPLLIEGLQQARDTYVPTVSVHRRFRILVEDDLDGLFPYGQRLLADPLANASVVDAVRGAGRVLLAVGPEGGWNEFETRLLVAHGFHAVGMGPRTLRTDTATIALLALTEDALRRAGARVEPA